MRASSKTNVIMELTDVIDYYMVLRTTLREYDEDVIKHDMKGSERDAFPMISNNVHMTAEILNWYQYEWAKPVRSISKEIDHDRRQQNAERINELTKHLYIATLSAIEYSAKAAVRMSTSKAFDKLKKRWLDRKRVYLDGIIKDSKESALIDPQTYDKWDALCELRNTVVHNNGHADMDRTYQIEDIPIPFNRGDTVRINMGFFPQLTGIAAKLYYQWLLNIHLITES